MTRLIDADALNLEYEVDMADDWKTAHEIANIVKYAPTIDAEPVKHGKWIETDEWDEFSGRLYKCSNCKTFVLGYFDNYCPYCGAYMRGESNDTKGD